MNVSFSTQRLKLKLLYLLCAVAFSPGFLQAQVFFEELEMLKNDSLEYVFYSEGNSGSLPGWGMPNHGTAYLLEGGQPGSNTLVYEPNPGFVGLDTVQVRYWDIPHLFTLTLKINVVPAFVYAENDYVSIDKNGTATFNVVANDQSSVTPYLDIIPVSNHGSATVASDSTITFTPATDFMGTTHFTYVVCADTVTCDIGRVTVFVEDSGSYTDTVKLSTKRNKDLDVFVSLANGFQEVNSPSNGSTSAQGNGTVTYSPSNNFTGLDTFTYAYNTNSNSSVRTFIVDVLDTPDENSFAYNDYAFLTIDGTDDIPVIANDLGDPANLDVKNTLPNSPSHGSATVNSDNTITYTPNAGFSGVDQFDYKVCLNNYCEVSTVYVVVTNQNPNQVAYNLSTKENTPFIINYRIPISNFDFVVSDPNTTEGGTVVYYPGYFDGIIHGQQVSGYNLLVYTPPADYDGLDDFDFQYCVGTSCMTINIDVFVEDVPNSQDTFCVSDCVFPGDANYDGMVNMRDLMPVGYCVGTNGVPRPNGSTSWVGQYGDQWGVSILTPTTDIKHVDTDGDGEIEALDTLSLSTYYGNQHNLTPEANPPISNIPLYFVPHNNNPQPGDFVLFDVVLGTDAKPVVGAHGLSFSINYNTEVVEESSFEVLFDDNSWMGYGSPMITMDKEPVDGKVDIGYTRTTGLSSSGYGVIGTYGFIIDDNIDGIRLQDSLRLEIRQTNGEIFSGSGNYIGLPESEIAIRINFDERGPRDIPTADYLVAFPNPARDQVTVHMNGRGNEIRELFIYNMVGQRVYASGRIDAKRHQINTLDLHNGLYVITALTNEGVISKKIEVFHD